MKRFSAAAWGLAAAIPLLIDWSWKVLIRPRPFWVYYYDPETIYFYEGLRILGGQAPHNVDHPGTTVQLLTAAIAALTGADPLRFDAFRIPAYLLALTLTLGAILLLRATLFRDSHPTFWVAGVWTWFMAPAALEFSTVWTAEIVYFALAALVLTAVWRIDDRRRTVFAAGLAIGICLATKFLFASWLVGLGAMLLSESRPWQERMKRSMVALAGAGGAFFAATMVAAPRYRYMLGWIWQLATHSSSYGYGPKQTPELTTVVRNFAAMLLQAWPWAVWIAVVVALLWWRRTADKPRAVFALTAMASALILAVRAPGGDFKYLLPMSAASIALVALLGQRRAPSVPLFAIAAILVIAGVAIDLRHHERRISEAAALRAEIDAAVERFAPNGVVVFSGRVPEPSFALRLETTDPAYLSTISQRFPREGHYPQWEGRLFLPDGASRWDVVVLHELLLDRFPEPRGRTVYVAAPYHVILRPGL